MLVRIWCWFIVVLCTQYLPAVSLKKRYDPDRDLPTPKIIRRRGFESETHEVITEDGYILSLHRIPNGGFDQSKKPILLHHGLLGSSADWVINSSNRSLAFQMAAEGWDIWLGNARGNRYSRGHIYLSPNDPRYWDFSWHEIGYYDLAASVDYILKVTDESSLMYVGHSMGTTASYVLCSSRPDYNKKFETIISLAPVAFISNTKSPIKYLAPYAKEIMIFTKWFGEGEFLPRSGVIDMFLKGTCDESFFAKSCENSLFLICGRDPNQFNSNLLPVIFGHIPAGASTKTLVHFAQGIESGCFQMFDYGPKENLLVYGVRSPPKYNLNNIIAPVALFYSDNDLVANPKDVEELNDLLPNSIGMFKINYTRFNHLDFLWSLDIYKLLNSKVENTLKSIPEKPIPNSKELSNINKLNGNEARKQKPEKDKVSNMVSWCQNFIHQQHKDGNPFKALF